MSARFPVNDSIVAWTAYLLARGISATLRSHVIGEEFLDRMHPNSGDSVVLVTWHGRSFVPVTRFRGLGYWAMISTSRDGNLQNKLFRRLGFRTVRGSSSARGAVEAVLIMRRELHKGGVLTLTPDGPRGPSGVLHPGAIYLAQKSGCPLVPAGASAWPCIKLKTWDRYLLPMPFARAALIYGDPIHVPPDLDQDGRQEYADRIGRMINDLELQADELARTGLGPSTGRAVASVAAGAGDPVHRH
ncbi:MAG: lysophospholipid acyltransferase family protein [Capsulimonadaceae bacterium]|nr:lysophospholipid acyltransferase family protein [Capsulimonadaceae bacterium]